MESRHCELLEKNRDKFIQTVDIDVLLPYFQATNLVSPADVISIATQTTKQTKITKFFDILCDNTSPQVFHTLCTALESTYPHLLTAMFLGASDGKKPLHSNNKTSNNHYSGSHGNSGSHSNSSPHGAPPHGTGVPHSASHSSHAHSHSHSSHSGTSTISTHSSSSQNPLYDSHAIPKSRSSGSTSRSNSSASKDSCGNAVGEIEEHPRGPPPPLPSTAAPTHRSMSGSVHSTQDHTISPQSSATPDALFQSTGASGRGSSQAPPPPFPRTRPPPRPVSLHEYDLQPQQPEPLVMKETHPSGVKALEMEEKRRVQEEWHKERMILRKQVHALAHENAELKKEVERGRRELLEREKKLRLAQDDQLKLTMDATRLRSERNAAVHEYKLVMSERDTVHKEIEQLQDKLTQAGERADKAEKERALATEEIKALQAQIDAGAEEHARVLQELHELKQTQASQEELGFGARLEGSKEADALRKDIERLQLELSDALQEVDDVKRGRDWAFSERDKIVHERESVRALSDQMRHERDSNFNKLIEAVRDLDEIKKQRQEALKDLKECKEKYDALVEKEARKSQLNSSISHNHSQDSAIDTDLQEWEVETLALSIAGINPDDLGFDLVGGRSDPQLPCDSDVFIGSVRQSSCAYGKLRANDQLVRVNTMELGRGVDKRAAYQAIRSGAVSGDTVSLVVRRKKLASSRAVISAHINLAANRDLGLNLENGLYVSRILPGSAAAKEGNLAVGDRILGVNGHSIEPLSAAEVMRMAQESGDQVTLNVLRYTPTPSSSISSTVILSSESSSPEHHSTTSIARTSPPSWIMQQSEVMTPAVPLMSPPGPQQAVPTASKAKPKRRERHERDERCKSVHPFLTASSDLDHSPGEDEVLDELNTIVNQMAKATKPKKQRENGTWPKCRAHTDYTNPASILPKIRPRLPDLVKDSKTYTERDGKGPPTPPERSDSFKRSASIKHAPPTKGAEPKPEQNIYPFEKKPCNTSQPPDYSVKSAKQEDLMKYIRPSPARVSRLSSSGEGTMHKPHSLDIQPTYATSADSPSGLPSKPSHAFHLPYYAPKMAQSYPQPGPAQPSHVPRAPFAVVSPMAPMSHSLPSSSLSPMLAHSPPPPGFQTSSTAHSLNASIPEMDPETFPRGKERFSTPSPCPSQQSSSTPLDHSTQSMSEDLPGFQPRRRTVPSEILHHPHLPHSVEYSSTFPHRSRHHHYPPPHHFAPERIRIPSTPSILSSKSSADGVSERGSPISPPPLSDFHHSLPKVLPHKYFRNHPTRGETRNIQVEKSVEPLGIQIESGSRGGIFVSSVSENSLAAKNGISVGDQLLEVCGINIRNATKDQASSVLRQMAGSINMLVQYNPDKYHDASSSSSSSSDASLPSASRVLPHSQSRISNETITPNDTPQTLSPQTLSPTHSAKGPVLLKPALEEPAPLEQPKFVVIKRLHSHDALGLSLLGGNAVGVFAHVVQPNSPAAKGGLRSGDLILECNGVNFRQFTLEQATNEIAKPVETLSLLVQSNLAKYKKVVDQPCGDAFYVRAMFDRRSEGDGELAFQRDAILFVDCTMYQENLGRWRAWLVDEQSGSKLTCGTIPSKTRLEDELCLKRSLSEPLAGGDEELKSSRGSSSRSSGSTARRSFFRKKKHQRNNSKDSRELSSFSDASINSDCVPFLDDGSVLTFERVERLDCSVCRPVLILGPLSEALINKLCAESPDRYSRCKPEIVKASLASIEASGQRDATYIDFKARSDGQFECITIQSVKDVMDNNCHCMLTIPPDALETLHKHKIHPITLFIKHKNARQIKEVKDTRFLPDKMSNKTAKELFDQFQECEHKHKRLFSDIIAGDNLAAMCYRIKISIEKEQKRSLWVPSGANL